MNYSEEALVFDCGGESLVGVAALPREPAAVGVLIVVGGPQYRAGSHRQFVLLARFLARKGVPCMRFDYRGMGDSTGPARNFAAVGEDIRAALDAFVRRLPSMRGVVLWGLCDGASAACLYAPGDARVAGLVLANPWVRTETGEAQVYLKHYYARRLIDARFWKKLLRGEVKLWASLRSLLSMAGRASAAARPAEDTQGEQELPDRMAAALGRCRIPFVVLLSGNDYVAREFEQEAQRRAKWRELMAGPRAERLTFASADHTFSSAQRREEAAFATWSWMTRRQLAREAIEATTEPIE